MHEEHMNSGLKVGNSLSGKKIIYFCNKMNVKIAAQTISSFVTDTIGFMMHLGHISCQNSEGAVEFLKLIDTIFDLLNVRNLYRNFLNNFLR